MEWTAIGAWAGEHGPYLAIIAIQQVIIVLFIRRFFSLIDLAVESLDLSKRATKIAEKAAGKER